MTVGRLVRGHVLRGVLRGVKGTPQLSCFAVPGCRFFHACRSLAFGENGFR
jgi:hypothetical protein